MATYRVVIYAKFGDDAEKNGVKTFSADNLDAAKIVAEEAYVYYDQRAKNLGSKHIPIFYEIFEGEEILYSSDNNLSIIYGS